MLIVGLFHQEFDILDLPPILTYHAIEDSGGSDEKNVLQVWKKKMGSEQSNKINTDL